MSSPLEIDGRPHVPVMLAEVLDALSPRDNEIFVDGTLGAGGYSQAILARAACRVIGIDRDPTAIAAGHRLAAASGGRLTLVEGRFGDMKRLLSALGISHVDGVVLDIGVSSMQLDVAERGFSFLRDGPLDMRMGVGGATAADLVNGLSQETLGRIIHVFGEEPRARAIARAIVTARTEAPITTTLGLVKAIEKVTGRQRPQDRVHPATRTFQALRIHVNSELNELISALHAAEELLQPEGRLVVVAFHSLEDRIVKRFLQSRSANTPAVSRHLPATGPGPVASFRLPFKGHLSASKEEAARNPRARSAKLRAGIRTGAPPMPSIAAELSIARGLEATH